MERIRIIGLYFIITSFFFLSGNGFEWSKRQRPLIDVAVNKNTVLPCDYVHNVSYNYFLLTWSRERPYKSNQWETLAVNSDDFGKKVLKMTTHFGMDFDRNSLIIHGVSESDHTQCKCTVRGDFYSSPAIVMLNVQFPPRDTSISATWPKLGKPLTITCGAHANPSAQYLFSRGSIQLQSSTNQTYKIDVYQTEHDATYTCTPSNSLGIGPKRSLVLGLGARTAQHKAPDTVAQKDYTLVGIVSAFGGILLIIIILLLVYIIRRPSANKEEHGQANTKPNDRYLQDRAQESHENEAYVVNSYYDTMAAPGPSNSAPTNATQGTQPHLRERCVAPETQATYVNAQDTQPSGHEQQVVPQSTQESQEHVYSSPYEPQGTQPNGHDQVAPDTTQETQALGYSSPGEPQGVQPHGHEQVAPDSTQETQALGYTSPDEAQGTQPNGHEQVAPDSTQETQGLGYTSPDESQGTQPNGHEQVAPDSTQETPGFGYTSPDEPQVTQPNVDDVSPDQAQASQDTKGNGNDTATGQGEQAGRLEEEDEKRAADTNSTPGTDDEVGQGGQQVIPGGGAAPRQDGKAGEDNGYCGNQEAEAGAQQSSNESGSNDDNGAEVIIKDGTNSTHIEEEEDGTLLKVL